MDTITTSAPHGFTVGKTVILKLEYSNRFIDWLKKIFRTRTWYKVSDVTSTSFSFDICGKETFWDRVKKKFKK